MEYLIPAFFAGGLFTTAVIMNSRLSEKTGHINAITVNFITGLIPAALMSMVFSRHSAFMIDSSNVYLLFTGGVMGVFIVSSNNRLVKKLPVVLYSILVFSGQIISGLVIDSRMNIRFSPLQIAGISLVFAGLLMNIFSVTENSDS